MTSTKTHEGCPKCGTVDTGRFYDGATVCVDCEPTSGETTPSDVIRRLGPVLDETSHVQSWDHTGGGCMMIAITHKDAVSGDHPALGITPEDGPFGSGWEDEPIADHHENPDLFMVIHYAAPEDTSDHQAGCLVRGDNLTAAVKEWATTGEISGWHETEDYDLPEVTGRPLTACAYTEDVWVCRDGVLVLHHAARESFWLHDESEVTTCPGCGGTGTVKS